MRKIIAFCGVKQSGKDTAYEAIKSNFKDAVSLTLAGNLKLACSEVFQIKRSIFEDGRLKEKQIDPPIFLNKQNIEKVIKYFDIDFNYDSHIRPHIGTIINTPRKLLQYIGTDILRNIDSNIHCKTISKDLPEEGLFIITDLRFPDEYTYFSNFECEFHPFYIFRRSAEVIALQDKHPSEQLIIETSKKCKVLDNNSTKIDFELLVVKTIKEVLCHI